MKKTKLLLILFALFAFGQMSWAQDQVSVSYVDENGTTQTHNAYKLDEFVSVSPSGVNIGNTGFTNWYFVEGNDVVINGQLGYYGGINLILCNGV